VQNVASILDPNRLCVALVSNQSNVSEVERQKNFGSGLFPTQIGRSSVHSPLRIICSLGPLQNGPGKLLGSSITHFRIDRFCWNLVW